MTNDLRLSDGHRVALCQLSYDSSRVPNWPLGARSLPRIFLDKDDDGTTVLTCEGTRPSFLGDWKADFDQSDLLIDPTVDPVPHGWGSLMLGVIFRILRDLPANEPVGWNGHSMGGSDCLIGAFLWKLSGRKLGRVTAFEPGPVGKLGALLLGESVLITRVGNGLGGDPVPEATLRGHPVEVMHLPARPGWSPIDCHELANVSLALRAGMASLPA